MATGSKRLAVGAAALAISSAVLWVVLAAVPSPAPAAASTAIARPAADPGPQRFQLIVAAALAAGRQRAEAVAAARARQGAALRAREHAHHVAHLAHERHLAQLAAAAAAARAPQRQVAAVPPPASTYTGSGAMQQCIIARESGGNSQAWNATGHYGLYQFSYSTWVAHGGSPADFGHAGVAEQNQVYYATVAADGYSDWAPYDGC